MMHRPGRQNEAQYSLVDLALGKLTPEQSLEVIERLEQDPLKSSELELIVNILGSAEALPAIEDSRNNSKRGSPSGVRERRSDFTLAIRSAAAIVLMLGSVFLSGEFSEDSYASLITVRAEDLDVRTRGRSAEILEIAYASS